MSLLDDFEDQANQLRWIRESDLYAKIHHDYYDDFVKYYEKCKTPEDHHVVFSVFDKMDNDDVPEYLANKIKSIVLLDGCTVNVQHDLLALKQNEADKYIKAFDKIIAKYGTKITKVIEGSFNDGRNPDITVEDKYGVLAPGDDFADIVTNVCKEKVVPSLFKKSDNGLSWNFPKNYIGSILQTIPIYFSNQKEYKDNDDGNYLGVYIRKSDEEKEIEEKEIVLFPDVFRRCVNNDDELKLLVWKVIVHEYAHALMDAGSEFDGWIDNKSYYKEQEESHANAFALRVLKKYPITPSQLGFIIDFINNQPPEYKKGIEVEENSANIGFDMIKWRTEKIIRQTMEIVWLQMRQYFNYDLDDFYTAFAFSVDYGGKNYTLGEPHSIEWCEGESYSDMVLTLEQINHFIVDFLLLIESSCDLDTELRILFTMCGVEEPYGYCVEDIKTHQILLSKRYKEQ